MSILNELYYGNISPADRCVKRGSEYHKLAKYIEESEEKLLVRLEPEERKLYESLLEFRDKQTFISERELFIDGFRIGARIMLEILTEQDNRLVQN